MLDPPISPPGIGDATFRVHTNAIVHKWHNGCDSSWEVMFVRMGRVYMNTRLRYQAPDRQSTGQGGPDTLEHVSGKEQCYAGAEGGRRMVMTLQRVLRPQSLTVILGLGILSVATAGLACSAFGATLPLLGEMASALVGVAGGTKIVLSA